MDGHRKFGVGIGIPQALRLGPLCLGVGRYRSPSQLRSCGYAVRRQPCGSCGSSVAPCRQSCTRHTTSVGPKKALHYAAK